MSASNASPIAITRLERKIKKAKAQGMHSRAEKLEEKLVVGPPHPTPPPLPCNPAKTRHVRKPRTRSPFPLPVHVGSGWCTPVPTPQSVPRAAVGWAVGRPGPRGETGGVASVQPLLHPQATGIDGPATRRNPSLFVHTCLNYGAPPFIRRVPCFE